MLETRSLCVHGVVSVGVVVQPDADNFPTKHFTEVAVIQQQLKMVHKLKSQKPETQRIIDFQDTYNLYIARVNERKGRQKKPSSNLPQSFPLKMPKQTNGDNQIYFCQPHTLLYGVRLKRDEGAFGQSFSSLFLRIS